MKSRFFSPCLFSVALHLYIVNDSEPQKEKFNAMEGNQTFDLRIYDLCRNKLQLSEGIAATATKELKALVDEERWDRLKQYLESERMARQDFEEFMDQRVAHLREDLQDFNNGLHTELRRSYNPSHHADILQWMFTYFAFVMGGVVAVLLLLLKK